MLVKGFLVVGRVYEIVGFRQLLLVNPPLQIFEVCGNGGFGVMSRTGSPACSTKSEEGRVYEIVGFRQLIIVGEPARTGF
jgi:hypothetical protein